MLAAHRVYTEPGAPSTKRLWALGATVVYRSNGCVLLSICTPPEKAEEARPWRQIR